MLLEELNSEYILESFNEIYLIEANKKPKLLQKANLQRATKRFRSSTNPESGKHRVQKAATSKLMKYEFHKKEAKEKFGNQYNIVSYRVLSKENTEKTADGHHGYIAYNASNRNIKQVFCDCKDFFFRLYAPYVSAEFATFDLDKPYSDYLIKKHNTKWTDETNPKGTLFLCKHLYRAMTDILDMENLSKIALARQKGVSEEEQELRDTIEADIRAQGETGGVPAEVKPPKPVPGEELDDVAEPTEEVPVEPVVEPEAPEEEPTPAPEPEPAPAAPVAQPKPLPKKPKPAAPEKVEPSEFEKEYDKFVGDIKQDEKDEEHEYEREKRLREKAVKSTDIKDLIKNKLNTEK
jgi:hypothetical protein